MFDNLPALKGKASSIRAAMVRDVLVNLVEFDPLRPQGATDFSLALAKRISDRLQTLDDADWFISNRGESLDELLFPDVVQEFSQLRDSQ